MTETVLHLSTVRFSCDVSEDSRCQGHWLAVPMVFAILGVVYIFWAFGLGRYLKTLYSRSRGTELTRPSGLPRRRSFGSSSNPSNKERVGGRKVRWAGVVDEPLRTSAWELKALRLATRYTLVLSLCSQVQVKVIKKRRTPSKINTG